MKMKGNDHVDLKKTLSILGDSISSKAPPRKIRKRIGSNNRMVDSNERTLDSDEKSLQGFATIRSKFKKSTSVSKRINSNKKGKKSAAEPVLYKKDTKLKPNQSIRQTEDGPAYIISKWNDDLRKLLVSEVNKLGGKVQGWYKILSNKGPFAGFSPHSINSMYNQLLRQNSPLISTDILLKEEARRSKYVRYQNSHIAMEDPALRKMRLTFEAKPKSYRDTYGKIFWGKFDAEPYWPCLTYPPFAAIAEDADDVNENIRQEQEDALSSDDSLVFVYWFGHSSYSTLDIKALTTFDEEGLRKFCPEAFGLSRSNELEPQTRMQLVKGLIEALHFKNGTFISRDLKQVYQLCLEAQTLSKGLFHVFQVVDLVANMRDHAPELDENVALGKVCELEDKFIIFLSLEPKKVTEEIISDMKGFISELGSLIYFSQKDLVKPESDTIKLLSLLLGSSVEREALSVFDIWSQRTGYNHTTSSKA
eukprot:snap_masked-scaffold_9-processed-gene-4.32-mRNA-1 protein AED:1.00 eAED:1.00 QI:0/0/0/0/1/1/5/0/476